MRPEAEEQPCQQAIECLAPCLAPKLCNSVQVSATTMRLFRLFSAVSILRVCRNRTFNAVVAGSNPARLTI